MIIHIVHRQTLSDITEILYAGFDGNMAQYILEANPGSTYVGHSTLELPPINPELNASFLVDFPRTPFSD